MIEVKQLGVQLGKAKILQDVSFSVHAGEVLALLGPNGAGKSTLLKCLSSQLTEPTGSIQLNGRPINDWPLYELAKQRAVLPQHSTLSFPFKVEEVVALGRSPHARSEADEQIINDAMQAAGIAHLAKRNYLTLSGGEQQRTHFSRILTQLMPLSAGDDKLLLLDEPVASLDLKYKHQLLAKARELAGQGVCVIVVLHDLELARRYADRVLMLNKGRVHADGPPKAVLTRETIREVYDFDPLEFMTDADLQRA